LPNTVDMLIVLLLLGEAAGAQEVGVVPAGRGPGLIPTAAVGRLLVGRLSHARPGRAALIYRLPEFPPPKKGSDRKASTLMKRAYRAFQMMEYKQAMTLADEAVKIYKDIAKSDQIEGYVEAQQLIAAAAFFDGDNARAQREMNDAYLADPRPPPPKRFSPQVHDLYTQVKSDAPAQGTVRIGSNPAGALVWFHSKLLGPATGTFHLRGGLYLVRAYLPGYALYQRWLRVNPHTTRDAMIALSREGAPQESVTLGKLREEAGTAEPGPTLNQLALDIGASQMILLTSSAACTPKRCRITMRWAKEGKWYRRRRALYTGDAVATAAVLARRRKAPTLAVIPPTGNGAITPMGQGSSRCNLDSDCSINQRCVGGSCKSPTPVYQKWWFWTLIGAAVAGATVGIVVPLTRPPAPVIGVE